MGHLAVLSIVGIHNPGLADFDYYVAEKLVTGPEVVRLPELMEKHLARAGNERPVATIDAVLTAMSDGTLLAPADAEARGPNLVDWLRSLDPMH